MISPDSAQSPVVDVIDGALADERVGNYNAT